MKRCWIIIVVSIYLFLANSCNQRSRRGLLYITNDTNPDSEIVTIKVLKQSQNQINADNLYYNYKEEINYKAYNWLVYDIPAGTWDVYIEYYAKGLFYNERERIIINISESETVWAAIWLVNNSDNSIFTEQGCGDLAISSNMF